MVVEPVVLDAIIRPVGHVYNEDPTWVANRPRVFGATDNPESSNTWRGRLGKQALPFGRRIYRGRATSSADRRLRRGSPGRYGDKGVRDGEEQARRQRTRSAE